MSATSTHDDLFQRLTTSALEFLRRAMAEAEANPKFALVHFCAGLELVLKARLLREHWSLVVTSKPDLRKFRSGDFESVSLSTSIERLASVVDDPLPKDTQAAFEKIARHRNRVIHFVHDMDDASQTKLKESIAAEICLGWLFLSQLLQHWSSHFRSSKLEIVKIDIGMRKVRTFLQVSFERMKPDIDSARASGNSIAVCPSCGFEAAIISQQERALHWQSCKVCHYGMNLVDYICDDNDCGIQHRFSSFNAFQPVNCDCGHLITQADLRKSLDDAPINDGEVRINCGECGAEDTVVRHGEKFLCVDCFHHDGEIGTCEWCGERQLGGSLLDSYVDGCVCCHGAKDGD